MKLVRRDVNLILDVRLDARLNAVEPEVERDHAADLPFGIQLLEGDLADLQGRAFADRLESSGKGIMVREFDHRGAEEIELIRHERIEAHKIVAVGKTAVLAHAVREVVDRGHVAREVVINRRNLGDSPRILFEKTGADDLADILGRELNLCIEATDDAREVVALRIVHLTHDVRDIRLRRHDNPAGVAAFRVELLGDGLQGQHQRRRVCDILSDFVDEEIEAEARSLLRDVVLDEIGEVLDREVLVDVATDDVRRARARHSRVGLVDLRTIAHDAGAPVCLPVTSGEFLELRLERGKMTFLLVELALKRRHGGVLLAIAAMGVEDLQERRENRVLAVGATRGIRLLPDIEENAPRGRARRTLDQPLQNREVFVTLAMLQKNLRRTPSADIAVLQHGSKDLEEVGLTGTEEARDPRAVGITVVVVLEERLEVDPDFIGDDKLL